MASVDWNVPQTEEGLQQILLRLEECRKVGDDVEIGNGLLALSFQVKWVRSDTDAGPFERSHELALEALQAFRRVDDVKGQVRALIASTAMADPSTSDAFLAEAELLAPEAGDENLYASVLAARARKLALVNRSQASAMHRSVLEIYSRTGNKEGQAQCLFSLSIGDGSNEENRDYALEGAKIYRQLGSPRMAAQCVMVALMNAEKLEEPSNLEDLANEGLKDALDAGNRSKEGYFYNKRALIAAAKGQADEAEKYRRWAKDIEHSDGVTPLERWESNVYMTKTLISTFKLQGDKDAEKMFKAELKRLRATKPSDG